MIEKSIEIKMAEDFDAAPYCHAGTDCKQT